MMRLARPTTLAVIFAPLLAFGVPPDAASVLAQGVPASQSPAKAGSVQALETVQVDEKTAATRVPARSGEICMVCNRPMGPDDVVYQVRGQRVAVHRWEVESDLQGQLARLLAQLKPRGAFLGAREDQQALSQLWFFVGLYVLVGLVFGALCAHCALHRGQNALLWLSIGLLHNIVGYLLLLTRPKREIAAPAGVPRGLRKIAATYAPQPCAKCATLNHPSASICLGCGAKLEPKLTSEVLRARVRSG